MNSKLKARSIANGILLLFVIFAIAGAVGFAWRSAAVSKLYGLNIEHPKVAVTNKLGLVRTTVGFEPDTSRFERTRSVWRWAMRNSPSVLVRISMTFPSMHWRLGIGSKPLQLDAHRMVWSSGGSSGYLYAIEPGVANSKWEFVHWTGMNIDELTADIVRQSFGDGPKELETTTVAAGQIIFTRLSTQPETIYVLQVQASHLNKAIVDYTSIPSSSDTSSK